MDIRGIDFCNYFFSKWFQSILPYLPLKHIRMNSKFFEMKIPEIFLHIWIPCKKVQQQTAFSFLKFAWDHVKKLKKLSKMKVSLTYPPFWQFLPFLNMFPCEFRKSKDSLC